MKRARLASAPLIEAWFDMLAGDARPHARRLRQLVQAAVPELGLSIKWGNLLFVLPDGRHALALAAQKAHLNLQCFSGHALQERFPMLDGNGKGLRSLKCRHSQPLDEALVTALTLACVRAVRDDAAAGAEADASD
jgi:hypothetical protein